MNDATKDGPWKQVGIQNESSSFDRVLSDLGYEADEPTDEGLTKTNRSIEPWLT
jgi:hypothetical protein